MNKNKRLVLKFIYRWIKVLCWLYAAGKTVDISKKWTKSKQCLIANVLGKLQKNFKDYELRLTEASETLWNYFIRTQKVAREKKTKQGTFNLNFWTQERSSSSAGMLGIVVEKRAKTSQRELFLCLLLSGRRDVQSNPGSWVFIGSFHSTLSAFP